MIKFLEANILVMFNNIRLVESEVDSIGFADIVVLIGIDRVS
jgi:hypothetical protein